MMRLSHWLGRVSSRLRWSQLLNRQSRRRWLRAVPTKGRFAGRMEALEQRLVLSGVNVGDGETFGQSEVIAAQQVDSYSQTAGGTLQIELGGTEAGTSFDQVNVTGAASLAGTVEVKLINRFLPEDGDTFDIMTFGSNSGSFDLATGFFGFGNGDMYFEVLEQSDRLQLVARELPGLRDRSIRRQLWKGCVVSDVLRSRMPL